MKRFLAVLCADPWHKKHSPKKGKCPKCGEQLRIPCYAANYIPIERQFTFYCSNCMKTQTGTISSDKIHHKAADQHSPDEDICYCEGAKDLFHYGCPSCGADVEIEISL